MNRVSFISDHSVSAEDPSRKEVNSLLLTAEDVGVPYSVVRHHVDGTMEVVDPLHGTQLISVSDEI